MAEILIGSNNLTDCLKGDVQIQTIQLGNSQLWTASNNLPSWFPQNVDASADLHSYYGTDMSNYFVDVLYYSGGKYAYTRCYCNTLNALSIFTNNMSPPTQLKCSYSGNNKQIAIRTISYNADGTYYTRYAQNWSSSNITLMSQSTSIFTPAVCIIDWGNTTFSTSTPSGYSFEILVAQ